MLPKNTITDSLGEPGGDAIEHIDSLLNSSFLYHSNAPKQDNLHCYMQSYLHARGAKSLAMKTIGQQVADYMKWRGWKVRQMAEHIQKQPGGGSVKRQHIENLMKDGVDQPKYLYALAASMGVTADDLLQGRYMPPADIPENTGGVKQAPSGPADTEKKVSDKRASVSTLDFVDALNTLASHVADIDPASWPELALLMAALINNPRSKGMIEAIRAYVEQASTEKHDTPEFGTRQPQQQQRRAA